MTLPRTSLVQRNKGFYHYNKSPTKVSGIFNYIAAMLQWGGQGCVVSRVGVGDYLITMDDLNITNILNCVCTVESAGTTDLVAKAEVITAGPPTTIQVTTWAGNVATELTATENVHFDITFEQGWNNEPDRHPKGYFHMTAGTTKIIGSVAIGAAGAVGVHYGRGFAMTRTAQGLYLLTFTDGFGSFLSGSCTVDDATGGTDLTAQFGTFTPGLVGACTWVVRTKTAGAQADPDATARIHFDVNLSSNASE